MSTPTILSSERKNKWRIVLFAMAVSLLSLYPIYKNFYNGRAILTYERHERLMKGESEYYNPWQYRMLCPLLVEGLLFVYNQTIDRIYPIEEKLDFSFTATSQPTPETAEFVEILKNKSGLKTWIVILFLRFAINFTIFLLAWKLWQKFVRNRLLIFLGLMLASLSMGNAVVASDLTLHTYMDNVFYLLAANIIVYRKNPLWLLPLIALASLNRETSMLIPFLYFISNMDFSRFSFPRIASIGFPPRRVWILTAVQYVIFFAVFFALRNYYGSRPPQVWKAPAGLSMIKLNLFSAVAVKSYFELLGFFSLIPFLLAYKFRSLPLQLRVWFVALVPVWFAVHIYTVVIYQTRLFFVPMAVVLIPALLSLIEGWYEKTGKPAYQRSGITEAI